MVQKSFDFEVEPPQGLKPNMEPSSTRDPQKQKLELSDVRPSNDGGVNAISGFEYQYHFALKKCIDWLVEPSNYQSISSETHDDIVISRTTGEYEFYQVKGKAEGKWSLAELKTAGVWQSFLRSQQTFGPTHRFYFVSDQTAQRGSSSHPDLSEMKRITRLGKQYCGIRENLVAEKLVTKLAELLDIDVKNRNEVESLFWNTHILTDYDRRKGLHARNLLDLLKLLNKRGISCDPANLERIYLQIKQLLIDRIIVDPELTYKEVLLQRELPFQKLEECLSGPYESIRLQHFRFDMDNDVRTLAGKMDAANFPQHIKHYFIESRAYFSIQHYQMMPHFAEYLARLRMKVWSLCVDRQVKHPGKPATSLYADILAGLETLAKDELEQGGPPNLDREYLHGMLCQLTAQCHHDWVELERDQTK